MSSTHEDEAVRAVLSKRDPYSMVVDGLWELLEQDSEFGTLVKPGNRVKFTGKNREPLKEEVGTSDLPEVRIVPTGSTPRQHGSSCSYVDTVTFEVQVASGDQRLDAYHLPLKFIVMRLMYRVQEFLKERVIWNNEQVVQVARPVSVREGYSEADLNRGIVGWSAVWGVEVQLWWKRSTL